MTCLACGAEITAGNRWCENCGQPTHPNPAVEGPAQPAAAPPPPLPPSPFPPTPWANPIPPPPTQTIFTAPAYAPPGPYPLPASPRGSRVGLIVVVSIVVLAIAGIGAFVAVGHTAKHTATPEFTTLPSTPNAPGVPDGYTAFVDRTDQFGIAVPARWRQIDLSTPGARQRLQQTLQTDPKLAAVAGSSETISKATKFSAIDLNLSGFSPNVNIGVEPAVGIRDADLPSALVGIRQAYARAGLTILRTTYIQLAGHKALQLTLTDASLRRIGAASSAQDYIAANDFMYILTFSGSSPDFHTIAGTFKVS